MFSEIDKTIFPNSCEVIYLGSSQQYVFPIMKNGSSSFFVQIQKQIRTDWKIIVNDKINQIDGTITVFLRHPRKRFISGVNTYLQHLERDYPGLDRKTVLWFINNYMFLNRHYCPQFFWLVNLSRFTNPNVKLMLQPMTEITNLTNMDHRANITPPTQTFLKEIETFDWPRLELYFYLDQLLVDRIGQTVTYHDLITDIQTNHKDLYDLIFKHTFNIINALPKT
jgi:hypothetical protein